MILSLGISYQRSLEIFLRFLIFSVILKILYGICGCIKALKALPTKKNYLILV